MARPDLRQKPRLESLETRQVLSGGAPSADAQYLLELVNLARTDPPKAAEVITSNLSGDQQATVDFYNVNLNQVKAQIASAPVQPPLAYSDQLGQSATRQSVDQINMGTQSHTGSDGSTLSVRIDRTGLTDTSKTGENTYAYSESVSDAAKAFLIDWGVAGSPHRNTIQEPGTPAANTYSSVGFGIVPTSKPGIGPLVVTQDFAAKRNELPTLLGVAFDDKSNNQLYTPGEGRSDVIISATDLQTGVTASTQTTPAGGYQMQLSPGNYRVTARIGSQIVKSQTTSIGSQNVKIDFITSNAWQGGSDSTPVVHAPVNVPVATPAVVSIPTRTPVAPIVTPPVVPTPVVVPVAVPVTVAVTDPTPVTTAITPATKPVQVMNDNPLVTGVSVEPISQASFSFDVAWVRSWKQWSIDKKKS